MAVTRTLATLGRLIRRIPPPPADVLEAYAHEVIPVLDRAEWLYQYWLEQSTLFTDSEKLGNVAAIHRWETATMGRSLERVVPPAPLAGAHEGVIDALELASRAAQLLSSGSRYHNANAVCEGQALLGTSRERRLAALKSMRRYLLQVPLARPTELEVGTDAAGDETNAPSAAPAALEPGQPPPLPVAAEPQEQPPLEPIEPAAPAPTPAASVPPPTSPDPHAPVQPQEPVAPPGWGSLFGRPGSRPEQ